MPQGGESPFRHSGRNFDRILAAETTAQLDFEVKLLGDQIEGMKSLFKQVFCT